MFSIYEKLALFHSEFLPLQKIYVTIIIYIFEQYGFLETVPDWLNQVKQAIKMLEEYSRYRNSDGVAGLTTNRTPWEEWANKRQKENWKTD